MFPSHYGSRSTDSAIVSIPAEKYVSIPLWFSLNSSVFSWLCDQVSFHPTMVLAQPFSKSFTKLALIMFPSHYGSRSTKLNSEKKISSSSFHPTMVLAQPEDQAPRRPSLQFPSHYGSRSTRGANSPAQDSALRFHPTLVLAQLERLERLGYIEFGFPSHIGSRSTKIYPNGFKPTLKFPSHIGSRSTRTPVS